MIKELIHSGSVATEENPSDRRSFYLHLTENGIYRLQSARRDLEVLTEKLSKRYSVTMVRALNEFVMKAGWK